MDAALRHRLERLKTRLDVLAAESLSPWLDHGRDPSGGVFGHLDRAFRPVFDAADEPRGPSGEVRGSKGLVQQARHLYAYSSYQARRPGLEACVAAAHGQYEHLLRVFGRRGEPFVHRVDRQHRSTDERVQLYAQGFAVFALAQFARTFSNHAAAACAGQSFWIVDQLRHDAVFGGYDQRDDGQWLTEVAAPPGAAKCTNTHIHVLEALTALCRAETHFRAAINDGVRTSDPVEATTAELVTTRLRELALIIATRMLQPAGYVHEFFAIDWTPVGPVEVSYGHDLETSWLLLDALDALDAASTVGVGRGTSGEGRERSVVAAAALRMAEHALRTGWDPAGGLFDRGTPEGRPDPPAVTSTEKVWWAQAEALPGLYRLYRATGDLRLLDYLEGTLDFMVRSSRDPVHGEFFWGVDSQGRIGPRGDHKGELWKTPYHGLRAFLVTADWIAEDLETDLW